MGEYFKKVETQGLTFPGFQTPLSHLICSLLGAKPLSFSDLCSRSKPGSRQVWQGASHLLPSKANRESERGGSWHLGGLPAQCTPCARRGSQHGSLFKESLALLSLSYSLLLFIVSNQGSSLFQRFPLLVRLPVGWLRITRSPQRQFVDFVLSSNECEVWWWRMVSKLLCARFDLWTIGPLC